MKHSKRFYLFFILALSICNPAFSQIGKISINSNIDSVLIFIDTLFIGFTPIADFNIAQGTHVLKGISQKIGKWDAEIIEKEIKLNSGDSICFDLNFKKALKIITVPENAKIILQNSTLGNSPINIFYKKNDTIKIEKENYYPKIVLLDTIKSELILIDLKIRENLESFQKNVQLIKKNSGNKLAYYIIGGGLAFGLMAVITKANADHLETEYRNNNDQETKEKIRLNDTLSGISLIAFEGCFLALSYLLLSN